MSLVGKKAPLFTAKAVINGNEAVTDFSLENLLGKQEIVLFFYPRDFSLVCPAEILVLQELLPEFEKRHVAVIGVCTDAEESRLDGLFKPDRQVGMEGITFPLVADTAKTIAASYGVLGGVWDYDDIGNLIFDGTPTAHHGTFLIDNKGIIRHEQINFFPMGSSIHTTLHIVDAWQVAEEHGEAYIAIREERRDVKANT